jgi:hypothetical protein
MRELHTDILFHALHASVAVAAFAPSAFAHYSTDPATPMALRSTPFDDTQPKIAIADEGRQLIGYFSGPGYDVWLDCLDPTGTSIWGAPVLVEDRDLISTVDWSLASDVEGNAYLTYNVSANGGGEHVQKVTKIDENGLVVWSQTFGQGPAGTLGNGRVIVTGDGYVWAATAVDDATAVQRFEPDHGTPSFLFELLVEETGYSQMCAGLQPASDGAVFLSTVRSESPDGERVLHAHRIEPGGSRPWGTEGVAVFGKGSLQYGHFPDFLPDGEGGAYFTWYTVEPLNARAQRMDAEGAMLWGMDGVAVSMNPVHDFGGTIAAVHRTEPQPILREDGRLVIFFNAYSEPIEGIVWFGIGAQCLGADGTRQWGVDGVMVDEYAPFEKGVVYDREVGAPLRFGSSVGISWVNFSSPSLSVAWAAHLDLDGSPEWKVAFATDATTKSRLVASPADTYGTVLAWQGDNDIFAGRIADDGTIGPPPLLIGDLNHDGEVNAADLTLFLGDWGGTGEADFNHDGVVDAVDLANLLANWTF